MSSERACEASEKLNPFTAPTDKDPLKSTVGEFGRWQLKISVLMALVKFPIAWFQMSIVFLAPPMNFWCKKWAQFENITDEQWRETIKQTETNKGYCYMPNITSNWFNDTEGSQLLIKCEGYSFNKTLFTSTITSEWDLVCDRDKYVDFSQVTLMFGVLLGNIIFGILADKYGRKKILLACLLVQSVFGVFASVSPYLWLFILLRFFLAMANGGTMVTSFVICMEVVGGKWRTIVPILYQIPFGFGYAFLSGMAFFLRDWRYLHLTISLISMLYVLIYWIVPESPRWLLAVGEREKAIIILDKAAKENKTDSFDVSNAMTNLSNARSRSKPDKISAKALFSTAELRKRSCLLCLNWAIAGITFFAFIQYMGHVSQNLFLTVALGGFTSLPGTILCVFLVSNYGRRRTITCSYLLTSACSLLILAFPKGVYAFDWPRLVLAGAGIIGLSVSIPAMYLYTGELFPTVLRNSGVGFMMMFSRLGSIIAPLLVSLQNVAGFLPLLIIGVASVAQAGLILPLSETHGKTLPDNIADLRNGKCFAEEDDINLNRINKLKEEEE